MYATDRGFFIQKDPAVAPKMMATYNPTNNNLGYININNYNFHSIYQNKGKPQEFFLNVTTSDDKPVDKVLKLTLDNPNDFLSGTITDMPPFHENHFKQDYLPYEVVQVGFWTFGLYNDNNHVKLIFQTDFQGAYECYFVDSFWNFYFNMSQEKYFTLTEDEDHKQFFLSTDKNLIIVYNLSIYGDYYKYIYTSVFNFQNQDSQPIKAMHFNAAFADAATGNVYVSNKEKNFMIYKNRLNDAKYTQDSSLFTMSAMSLSGIDSTYQTLQFYADPFGNKWILTTHGLFYSFTLQSFEESYFMEANDGLKDVGSISYLFVAKNQKQELQAFANTDKGLFIGYKMVVPPKPTPTPTPEPTPSANNHENSKISLFAWIGLGAGAVLWIGAATGAGFFLSRKKK